MTTRREEAAARRSKVAVRFDGVWSDLREQCHVARARQRRADAHDAGEDRPRSPSLIIDEFVAAPEAVARPEEISAELEHDPARSWMSAEPGAPWIYEPSLSERPLDARDATDATKHKPSKPQLA